jgi:hypothetical protein
MKKYIYFLTVILLFVSCGTKNSNTLPLTGTWRLISAETTERDSTFSTFNPKTKMIKIINESHFAFFNHDLNNGKDSTNAIFFGGGGKYTLKDSIYTENLEYFNNRQWENNKFEFVVKIQNDTLIQEGIEKLEKLGINRIITEKYVREK